ncbi:thymidine phosphorylase [Piscinibacter terrae]|uniref:Thymidine phosphorylase n=1 Tax=Piscinibacter terrae TaxID=2496871 RepID=A0A3N7HHM3_9BURK|nr:thymidine phosphorylase [Albitalea terrae]RQP21518.1 thymidine phosphorylase [Albitalea terrae]
MTLAQETIRRKRDGQALDAAQIRAFVDGVTRGEVSDAQIAAFAMATCWRGMSTTEAVALTMAMRDSGRVLDWRGEDLHGPVVDKHSTGGIGDTVSLMLGPLLAACGCHVPMISGRGLGHTGGTLDKLESIPGYRVDVPLDTFRRVVREAGVAIVGAGPDLAPADRRIYAVRDLTATVESVALITASILSKKLAAGLQALALDVKVGSGAFMRDMPSALALARSLVETGCGAGLPTEALITDMNEPLAPVAGNALEVRMALRYLRGDERPARLDRVVRAFGASLLRQAGLARDDDEAQARLAQALDSGQAAERWARMVSGLGGPKDLLDHADRHLPAAPVVRPVPVPPSQVGMAVSSIDTRALGLAVVELGGGRRQAADRIDPAVGLASLLPLGAALDGSRPLAIVHAATQAAADAAVQAVQSAYAVSTTPVPAPPLIAGHIVREQGETSA